MSYEARHKVPAPRHATVSLHLVRYGLVGLAVLAVGSVLLGLAMMFGGAR